MLGQGGPQARFADRWIRPAPFRAAPLGRLLAMLLGLSPLALSPLALGQLVGPQAQTPATDVTLRLEWGGPDPSQWRVQVQALDGVEFSETRRLGMTADTPGAWRVSSQQIILFQLSPRTYDGVQFNARGAVDARVRILASHRQLAKPLVLERPLADFIRGVQRLDLEEGESPDATGLLLVRRAPGDALRVSVPNSQLVFEPNEKVQLQCQARAAGLDPGGYRLRVVVQPARGGVVAWQEEFDISINAQGDSETIAVQAPLPAQEGAYDVTFAIVRRRLPTPFSRTTTMLQRNFQCVVISSEDVPASTETWRVLAEMNPAQPAANGWINRLTGLRFWFSGDEPQPFGEGLSSDLVNGRSWSKLAPGGWQAFPLPLAEPGRPHIIELELLRADQSLMTSILEQDHEGNYVLVNMDGGVDVQDVFRANPKGGVRHRLVHWPHGGKPPLLLLSNPTEAPAYFGNIRVHAGPERLAGRSQLGRSSQRLAALF